MPTTRKKSGVEVGFLQPASLVALIMATGVFHSRGYDCIVTSGTEGRHSRGSRHYLGYALDLRSKHVKEEDKLPILHALTDALGEEYDVILEGRGANWEHYHIEFDPKKGTDR